MRVRTRRLRTTQTLRRPTRLWRQTRCRRTRPWPRRAPMVLSTSNRAPGLGNAEGRIDLQSEWMTAAAAADPEVANFARRAEGWRLAWVVELREADRDFFAFGCDCPIEE